MVCLNPKVDFSLWINFEHTIQFTYYTDCLPFALNASATKAGILLCLVHLCISGWAIVLGAQWLSFIGGSNQHKFKVGHYQGGEEVRNKNPLTLLMRLHTCTICLTAIWQCLVKLKYTW